jgi:hypothetical protein
MNRTYLLQNIISKFNYKSYLEIGCRYDENYNLISIENKIGVDPASGGTHRMTSDEFFESNNLKFDIIFIDGLHISNQVDLDIENSLKFLNENGTIVLHDCSPAIEENQRQYIINSDWNGDVWKSFVKQRCLPNIDAATANFDHGCGVLRVRNNTDQINVERNMLTWKNLELNRQRWLRLMPFNQLINWI